MRPRARDLCYQGGLCAVEGCNLEKIPVVVGYSVGIGDSGVIGVHAVIMVVVFLFVYIYIAMVHVYDGEGD